MNKKINKIMIRALIMVMLTALAATFIALSPAPAIAEEDVGEEVGDVQEEMEELEFARFVATGNDPYGTFIFKDLDGDNVVIDPDDVLWAAVRYRTISQYDTTGVEFGGQLYVVPPAEPFIPVTYVHSGQWETAIVNLTSVSSKTELDSKWDSISYGSKDRIRFDPLEPDRDAEADEQEGTSGKVKKGDSIDIAWIAFFEDEYSARAYSGRERTPVAILNADALSTITDAYHLIATKLSEMAVLPSAAPATEVPTAAPTKAPTEVPVTNAPTAAPATDNAPASATEPASDPDNKTDKDEKGGNKTGLIIGIIAAVVVCGAVAALLIVKGKKSKK